MVAAAAVQIQEGEVFGVAVADQLAGKEDAQRLVAVAAVVPVELAAYRFGEVPVALMAEMA